MIMPPPTDAMGDSSLLFVLALGRQKIGSASALSGFPLEVFPRGQTIQRRQPLTIMCSVGRMVGSPVGGYIGAYLVQYSLVGRTTQLMAHQLRGLAVQCLDSLAARLDGATVYGSTAQPPDSLGLMARRLIAWRLNGAAQ